MHKEILTKEQINLSPLLKLFLKDFGLVGGTAIALYIGHRKSIDFDLFSNKPFDNFKIKRKISKYAKIDNVLKDEEGQYTITIKDVGFAFFYYPYKIKFSKKIDGIIKAPDLLTLAAMKSFALGRRAKWKDYIDLYFVMKNYYGIDKIIKRAKQIFGNEFNEKIFRAQLAYFKDIDYSEKIIFMKNYETDDKTIQKGLINFSLAKA
jgi:hypothetical protein